MKVLLTGASGQVGRALTDVTPAHVELRTVTHTQLDIVDLGAVERMFEDFRPNLVINAAAYTAVDKAESEPALADATNVDGARNLAVAADSISDCRLLHVSTDYVFDGRSLVPYKPSDLTNPLSVYGRSKLLGEQAVFEVLGKRAVVLRTAWVYAAQGKNFLLTMLRLMRERGNVRVVADQRGTPTSASSIAQALWVVAERAHISGILHWTDEGAATWFEFALAIAKEGRDVGLLPNPVEVAAIATSDYPTAAHRPRNSVLDIRESVDLLGYAPSQWQTNLRGTVEEIVRADLVTRSIGSIAPTL